ncbi:MAG TPA: hypothetical protein VF254_08680 [Gammaproteobacteria bacterium]
MHPAVAGQTLIVLVVVSGAVEYLAPGGEVAARYTADTPLALYHRYCEEHGVAPLDLLD